MPTIVEIQLRNNRLLRDTINTYRRGERYSNSSKIQKTSSIKTLDKEALLIIDTEPLCPREFNDIPNSSSDILPKAQVNLTSLMKKIHNQCKNKVSIYFLNISFSTLFQIEKEEISC